MSSDDNDPRSSQEFTQLASAFLDDVAPDFACSVCNNDTFDVVEKLKGDYYPFIYSINYDTDRKKRFRQWLLICSRCGHTYSFSRGAILSWADKKGIRNDA